MGMTSKVRGCHFRVFIVFVSLLVLLGSVVAFGDYQSVDEVYAGIVPYLTDEESPPVTALVSGGTIEFSGKNNMPTAAEMRGLTKFMSELSNASSVPQSEKKEVYRRLQMANSGAYNETIMLLSNTGADIAGGVALLAPLQPFVALALGAGAVVVTFIVAITTIADMIFLGNPSVWGAGGDKDGKKSGFSLISGEARRAVQMSMDFNGDQGKNGYVNPYWIYLRLRGTTYILVAVSLYLLVTGQINQISIWLINIISGGLELFGLA